MSLMLFQGKTFISQVQDYYTNYEWLSQFETYYATREGREFCDGLWDVCRQRFPHFMDELRGMADGAKVDFLKVGYLHNIPG